MEPSGDSTLWDSQDDNFSESAGLEATIFDGIRWDEIFRCPSDDQITYELLDESTPDAAPHIQTTDLQFNHFDLDLEKNPTYGISNLDCITNLDPPQTEPDLMMELTSPSSSGDINQTPSLGDFGLNSSPEIWETPYLSPISTMERSPQTYLAMLHHPAIDAGRSQFMTDQLNGSLCMGEGVALEALIMSPTSNVHQSLAQTATEPRHLTMKDRHPDISAYVLFMLC